MSDLIARRSSMAAYASAMPSRLVSKSEYATRIDAALQDPELGRLDLEFTIFQVAEQPSLRLYLYTPADDGRTEAQLRETVAGRLPAQLCQ